MTQRANRGRQRFYAVLAASLLPLAAAGSSIVDIIDWKPIDLMPPTAAGDAGPGGSQWRQTVFPDTGIDAATGPRWYEEFSRRPDDLVAGTWDAARWTEVDLWAASGEARARLDADIFLAELAGTDWIGMSPYGDVQDAELYGLDEYKLLVPEPAGILMLAAAFGVAALAMRKRRGEGQAFSA